MHKELIRKNFIKGASNYNAHTPVQQHMAELVAEVTSKYLVNPCSALEFGAGTGHLTQLLTQIPNIKHLDCVDLSLKSLMMNQMKISQNQSSLKPNFIEADIEKYKIPNCCGLITSNATLQWLNDPELTLLNIAKTLSSQNGLLTLGIFGENNLKRFYETRNEAANRIIDKPVRYFNHQEILGILSNTEIEVLEVKSYTYMQKFASFWDLIASFTTIGAQGDPTLLKPSEMKKWQKLYCPIDDEAVAEWDYMIIAIRCHSHP
jgi:trans-aconitate methyltransferase